MHSKIMTVRNIYMVIGVFLLQNSEAVRTLSAIKVGAVNSEIGREPYKDMPTSTEHPGIERFEKVEPEPGFYQNMDMYCLIGDPRFCLFFDKKENVVGLQISYPIKDVQEVRSRYNYDSPNYLKTNFFGIPAYSVRVYFVKPDELTENGRNSSSPDILDGLWAKVNGELLRFDHRCQPNAPNIQGMFFKQGCVDMIGQIYSRRFYQEGECYNAFWLFLMYNEGSLVGFGHAAPGIVSPGPDGDLFNHPIKERTGPRLHPDLPECFSAVDDYDFSTLHVYLIEDPWNIRCPRCFCNA